MAFITITPGQTNANSPVDVALMDTYRTNLDDLDNRAITNGNAHDHNGGDGATIPQDGLKTTTGFVSTATGAAQLILPGGEYGFYPQLKMDPTTGTNWLAAMHSHENTLGGSYIITGKASYTSLIVLGATSGTIYAQQRYVTACPPYRIGNKKWGHFLYMLVNSQGDVMSSYEAENPPYAYNGPSQNAKDSIERIQAVPHPFADYFDKDPAADGLEIVLVDLREYDTEKWKADNAKQGKSILEDLGNINKGGRIITPQEVGIGNIQGFTDRVKIRKA
jgi:hypothetical protein